MIRNIMQTDSVRIGSGFAGVLKKSSRAGGGISEQQFDVDHSGLTAAIKKNIYCKIAHSGFLCAFNCPTFADYIQI
jgi:hypothetical protein